MFQKLLLVVALCIPAVNCSAYHDRIDTGNSIMLGATSGAFSYIMYKLWAGQNPEYKMTNATIAAISGLLAQQAVIIDGQVATAVNYPAMSVSFITTNILAAHVDSAISFAGKKTVAAIVYLASKMTQEKKEIA